MKEINLICSHCHEELFSGFPYWLEKKAFVCAVCGKTTYCESSSVNRKEETTIIPVSDSIDEKQSNGLWIILFMFLPYPLSFFLSLYVRERISKKLGTIMLWIFLLITILIYAYCIHVYFKGVQGNIRLRENMQKVFNR